MDLNSADRVIGLEDSDEISLKQLLFKLKDWWKFLISKWVVIISITAFGALLGLLYAVFEKPLYQAELSFALEDKPAGALGAAAGLASQFGFDIGGSDNGIFSGDNLLELMKSRSMIEKALLSAVRINGKQESLANFYIDINDLRSKWEPELKNINFAINADRSKFSLQQDSVLGQIHKAILKNSLLVNKIDKKLTIIKITVTSPDQHFSKYFSESLTDVVSHFYIVTKTKKSTENVNILQHQTDSVRAQLNGAISNVASSIDINPNANPSRLTLRVPSQRRQIDVQTNTAILTELVKNLEISKIGLRKETPLIQIIDKPILPLEKLKLGKAKGLVMGGVIAGMLVVLVLSLKRSLKKILG